MLEERAYVVFSAELQELLDGLCLQHPEHIKELEIAFKVEAPE